ncbi:50S ribosomal protein L6 [bacterium]|nr:50S ribosomal protein L6 [bacterium]
MSRIGKKPILIPEGTEVEIKDRVVFFKGPKGNLSQSIPEGIGVKKEEAKLLVFLERKNKNTPALWGLTRALLQNCVDGVNKGFEKKLEMVGIGYRAKKEGENILNLEVGFSHPIKLEIPKGLDVSLEKNIIAIFGIDKQKVGEFAAKIRKIRPPEPYKGKGIRYLGERIRRKEGKKAAGATT